MIPKKIHYCWFGKNEKSELIKNCIESWKKYCSDCEIIEWNESNFDVNQNIYTKEAYEKQKWAFVSDYARLWAVYNYGGIYLDTDVELIKNIDFVFDNENFFCYENDTYINTGLGFGAVEKSKIVKEIMSDYDNIHFIQKNGKLDLTPCPQRNTKILNNIDKNLFVTYPKEMFNPIDYNTKVKNITDRTVAIHWYGSSWMTKKQKLERYIKNTIKNLLGDKIFQFIKRKLKKEI